MFFRGDLGNDIANLANGFQRRSLCLTRDLALLDGGFTRDFGDELLLVIVELVPERLADQDDLRIVVMTCGREVFLDLMIFGTQRKRCNRFLSVDGTGLECGVEFCHRHRRRVGPQRSPHVDQKRVLLHTDFQACQILKLVHFTLVVGQNAIALFPEGEADHAMLGKLVGQFLAHIAIEQLIQNSFILIDERQIENTEVWNLRDHVARIPNHHFDDTTL